MDMSIFFIPVTPEQFFHLGLINYHLFRIMKTVLLFELLGTPQTREFPLFLGI
ncbi:hypothetical protein [Citrobacter freundii]|uniref:Uncharacterized protein n=1 Tax=Citrobacter freundii TaxID=546 RepID=A0A7G2IZN0_CITFR|nr:hypothetical protein [Citrobacter freundii]